MFVEEKNLSVFSIGFKLIIIIIPFYTFSKWAEWGAPLNIISQPILSAGASKAIRMGRYENGMDFSLFHSPLLLLQKRGTLGMMRWWNGPFVNSQIVMTWWVHSILFSFFIMQTYNTYSCNKSTTWGDSCKEVLLEKYR